MIVKAALKSYEKVDFSITLTAPVEDWRVMLTILDDRVTRNGNRPWPVSGFVVCIEKMLSDLDKTHSDALIHESEQR